VTNNNDENMNKGYRGRKSVKGCLSKHLGGQNQEEGPYTLMKQAILHRVWAPFKIILNYATQPFF